tara:strand:- start:141 stop:410 length:270 start_codon:yes stop_codon:yes gene_type:complete
MIKEKHKTVIKEFLLGNAETWIWEDRQFLLEAIANSPECDDLSLAEMFEYLRSQPPHSIEGLWATTVPADYFDEDELAEFREDRQARAA